MSTSTARVYFTILPLKNCGFTDQIFQFSSFYKLGIALGYKYIHTEFRTSRSSEKIYQFLGFNNHFFLKTAILRARLKIEEILGLCSRDYFKIQLGDDLLQANNVNDFEQLQSLVRDLVLKKANTSKKENIIVTFTLTRTDRRNFFTLIQSNIIDFPDGLDLRSSYLKTRILNPRKSIFINRKLKILVHIRQGDTAVIKTPWQTFIPLRLSKSSVQLTEFNSRTQEIYDSTIEPEEYYFFIKQLIDYFNEDNFSIGVFSDGFERGFQFIYENIQALNLTSEQIQKLKQSEYSYNEEKFRLFKNLKDSILWIGEDEESLYDLVHASFTADIIIIGTQQRMIPKLIANYYDLNNPPLVILLHKRQCPPNHYQDLSLDSRKAKIIPVNLDDYNFEYIAAQISQEILDKTAKDCFQ